MVRAADETPAEESAAAKLDDAWWRTAQMIGAGAPWNEAADTLNDALLSAGNAKFSQRCRNLSVSIGLSQTASPNAQRIAATLSERSSTQDLITGLQETRVSFDLVLRPLLKYGIDRQLAWAYVADRIAGGRDSAAYLLYARGREAIPELLDALEDQRATRSVADNRSRPMPLVMRVGDVSLALVEAISCCRFHIEPKRYEPRGHQTPLFSEWGDEKRRDQIALVRDWWETTKHLSRAEAALWWINRVERGEQLEMIDALILTGDADAAVEYLRTKYRQENDIDVDFAERMLMAGSREPLEYLRQAVRNDRPIERDFVKLVAHYGNIDDFKLLRSEIMRPCHDGYPVDRGMVVNELQQSNDPLTIPIFVALLETKEEAAECNPHLNPENERVIGYLLRSAERIERLSGKDFGFTHLASNYAAQRGFEDILNWWKREGKAAFDLDQVRPDAPGGIR